MNVGVTRIGLGDTAGVSNPVHTKEIIRALKTICDVSQIGIHLHDTYGMGLANAYAAVEEGITAIDAAAGGLGGCPFVPGAKGNIATEDLVYMLHAMGYHTGYDLDKVLGWSVPCVTTFKRRRPAVLLRLVKVSNAKKIQLQEVKNETINDG